MHYLTRFAILILLIAIVTPVFADTEFLIGAGPDIGIFDLADGKKTPGLQARAMLHTGLSDNRASFRLDGSYFRFWADGEQNSDYDGIAVVANLMLRLGASSGVDPYWALGLGYNRFWDSEGYAGHDTWDIVVGTGLGVRLDWGNIEARVETAGTSSGTGLHVPIFVALRF